MLRVGLGEYDTGWQSPEYSLGRAIELIGSRARAGARLVVLPEMCPSGFAVTAEAAELLEGESCKRLAAAASKNEVFVLAGVATRRDGRCYNSALLFGPEGTLCAAYDKQRLFCYADEDRVFSAGTGPVIFEIDGVRATVLICYDLRFPLLFAEVCPYVDLALVIANWPEEREMHWQALTRARAIENQVYVVGVNRTGEGGGLFYRGGSVAFLPSGESVIGGEPSGGIVAVDPDRVTEVRTAFPTVEDRRGHASGVERFSQSWTASRQLLVRGSMNP